jgi:thiamine-monophosphate kinase
MPRPPADEPPTDDRIVDETDLIETYLAPLAAGHPGAFGLRDDAAVLSPRPGTDLVFTSDPIIAGVHFFPDGDPADIAWKALAVNASDLAAKGARPLAYMLNLAFPETPTRGWMSAFAEGLRLAQQSFGCHLIGGDTDVTSGPLSIGITIIGTVLSGQFVRRQGARAGHHVFVTGTIGDAALGLAVQKDRAIFPSLSHDARAYLSSRYFRPMPRLALAETLRAHASAALDVSDGLLKDLSRLAGPFLGLSLDFGLIPLSKAAASVLASDPTIAPTILGGGDDYELLVAVPAASVAAFRLGAESAGIEVSDLGPLEASAPLRVLRADGTRMEIRRPGYDHFSR